MEDWKGNGRKGVKRVGMEDGVDGRTEEGIGKDWKGG